MENFSSDFLKSTLIVFEEINQETSILFPDIPQDSVMLFLTILNSVNFPLFTKVPSFWSSSSKGTKDANLKNLTLTLSFSYSKISEASISKFKVFNGNKVEFLNVKEANNFYFCVTSISISINLVSL